MAATEATEATEPLTEAQVDALDAAYQRSIAAKEPWESKTEAVDAFKNRAAEMVPALIRDWRGMKARLTACEGSRRVHELDNHHNALACGYCAGPIKEESTRLTAENAALREQLADITSERDRWEKRARELGHLDNYNDGTI